MNEIFRRIWKLAKPYYEKGRHYDIPHIEWMMKEADRIADIEKLDKNILLPICILHDVGYFAVKEKNPDSKNEEYKKIHMKEGAKIADKILTEVNYDPDLKNKIVYYISVHDNWLFGDDSPYRECKEMALFNDLDFLYMFSTKESFNMINKGMGLNSKEGIDFWIKDEKLTRRPFCCEETKKMWKRFIKERKRDS